MQILHPEIRVDHVLGLERQAKGQLSARGHGASTMGELGGGDARRLIGGLMPSIPWKY
jgi:hypothetical protein